MAFERRFFGDVHLHFDDPDRTLVMQQAAERTDRLGTNARLRKQKDGF